MELRTLDAVVTREIESTIRRINLNARMEALWQQFGRKLEKQLLISKLEELVGPTYNKKLLRETVECFPDVVLSAAAELVQDEEVEVVDVVPSAAALPAAAATALPAAVPRPMMSKF